jgi:hypothetical protein
LCRLAPRAAAGLTRRCTRMVGPGDQACVETGFDRLPARGQLGHRHTDLPPTVR